MLAWNIDCRFWRSRARVNSVCKLMMMTVAAQTWYKKPISQKGANGRNSRRNTMWYKSISEKYLLVIIKQIEKIHTHKLPETI